MSGTTLEKRLANLEKEIKSLKTGKSASGKNTVKFEDNLAGIYLKNILANLPENFYWTDKNGVVLGCNENQAKLFGLTSASELIGKTVYDVAEMLGWDKSIPDAVRKNDLEVMKTRKSLKAEENAILDGKVRTFISFKNPLMDDKNRVIGVFGVTLDITERKEMEELLREEKEKAESANKLKNEFIRNMEHDIRTPVAGMFMISKTLAEKEIDPHKKELLEVMSMATKELLDYANNILEFSRIEEESVLVLDKKFSLKELVDGVLSMENPAAKIKNLKLELIYAQDLPEILVGDPHRLKAILINLLSNAIKFTPSGYVKLIVESLKKEDHQIILHILVEDTGIGIPKDKQSIIYERFVRGTPANQGIYKGFGLGLNIVKKFINEMNGEIDVKSEEGKGTTFICTIPFKLPLSSESAKEVLEHEY